MEAVEDFDAFYDRTRGALLHQTYALTGDLAAATHALELGYVHAWNDWAKVAPLADRAAWVRGEAWHHVGRARRHLTTRRRSPAADRAHPGHLARLQRLTPAQRRAVVLHHLAGLPADQVGQLLEVSTTVAEESLSTASRIWTVSADTQDHDVALDEALRQLEPDTSRVTMRSAAAIRRASDTRHRRNVVLAIGTAVALLAGGWVLISQQSDTDSPGAQTSDTGEATTPPTVSPDDMLTLDAIAALSDQHAVWNLLPSANALNQQDVYAVCQRETLADPAAKAVALRRFAARGAPRTGALQVVEQSATPEAARAGYAEMESWYTTCDQPGVHLVETLDLRGVGDEGGLVVLREVSGAWSTVGVARTGTVSTAVVATTYGGEPIGPRRLAHRMAGNIGALCTVGNGSCAADPIVTRVPPVPLEDNPGFLAELDLPPVPGVPQPWVGTAPTRALRNPSQTACDQARFAVDQRPRARVFVIPEARQVPSRFGLSETVARFSGPRAAERFMTATVSRVEDCPDRELNATVSGAGSFAAGRLPVRVWRFRFDLAGGPSAEFRVGLVRRGPAIAQVTLTPAGDYDLTDEQFGALLVRAGERLTALP
jgi:DNA-directed RNA polymerase specialized sigma24 family protein